jgi:hypothetical protein
MEPDRPLSEFESFWSRYSGTAMANIITGVRAFDPKDGMRKAVLEIWKVWEDERRARNTKEEEEIENRLRSEKFNVPELSPAKEGFLFGFKRGVYYKELVGILRLQIEKLERGLAFYAEGKHYELDGDSTIDSWDTVSGERGNWLAPPPVEGVDPPWMVENGGIARATLEGHHSGWTLLIEELPPERTLVVGRWKFPEEVPGGGTRQTIQVAFHEAGVWYAWHFGSFAPRLVDPDSWAFVGADTPPVDSWRKE